MSLLELTLMCPSTALYGAGFHKFQGREIEGQKTGVRQRRRPEASGTKGDGKRAGRMPTLQGKAMILDVTNVTGNGDANHRSA